MGFVRWVCGQIKMCWVCHQYQGQLKKIHAYGFNGGKRGHCPACGRKVSEFVQSDPDYRDRSTLYKAEHSVFAPTKFAQPSSGW